MKYKNGKKGANLFSLGCLMQVSTLFSQDPIGFVAGEQGTLIPYASYVYDDGTTRRVSLNATIGRIVTAPTNTSGRVLVAGVSDSSSLMYASFIDPIGIVTPISLPAGVGSMVSALNDSGVGLLYAGYTLGSAQTYIGLVSPQGVTNQFSLSTFSTSIQTCGLNNGGYGYCVGRDNTAGQGYVGLITPSPTPAVNIVRTLSTISLVSGSLNGNNKLVVGGYVTANDAPYLQQVDFSGNFTPMATPGLTAARFLGLAINNAGQGVAVGDNRIAGTDTPFIALFDLSGNFRLLPTPYTGLGFLSRAAINQAGVSLVGGLKAQTSNLPYAAFILSDGTVKPIDFGAATGTVTSVAINQYGQGMVGGSASVTSTPYAFLVSQEGFMAPIDLGITAGLPRSMAFFPNLTAPLPTAGFSGNSLSLTNYINQNAPNLFFYFIPSQRNGTYTNALNSISPAGNGNTSFVAATNTFLTTKALNLQSRSRTVLQNTGDTLISFARKKGATKEDIVATTGAIAKNSTPKKYQGWIEGIGAFSYQKAQNQTPGFNPSTGGFALGVDRNVWDKSWLGLGFSYLYTHVNEKNNAGYSNINQEVVFSYGAFDWRNFYLDGALLFGFYQTHQVRNIQITGLSTQATSNPTGWSCTPHAEVGYNYFADWNKLKGEWTLNPFVTVDWVNNWQGAYQETGGVPFNFGQNSQYAALVRTEVGCRFWQTYALSKANLFFEEKGSYANVQLGRAGYMNAYLVGAPGSFVVETMTSAQNLGIVQAGLGIDPLNKKYPTASAFYQGEFGSGYMLNQVNLNLSWSF